MSKKPVNRFNLCRTDSRSPVGGEKGKTTFHLAPLRSPLKKKHRVVNRRELDSDPIEPVNDKIERREDPDDPISPVGNSMVKCNRSDGDEMVQKIIETLKYETVYPFKVLLTRMDAVNRETITNFFEILSQNKIRICVLYDNGKLRVSATIFWITEVVSTRLSEEETKWEIKTVDRTTAVFIAGREKSSITIRTPLSTSVVDSDGFYKFNDRKPLKFKSIYFFV